MRKLVWLTLTLVLSLAGIAMATYKADYWQCDKYYSSVGPVYTDPNGAGPDVLMVGAGSTWCYTTQTEKLVPAMLSDAQSRSGSATSNATFTFTVTNHDPVKYSVSWSLSGESTGTGSATASAAIGGEASVTSKNKLTFGSHLYIYNDKDLEAAASSTASIESYSAPDIETDTWTVASNTQNAGMTSVAHVTTYSEAEAEVSISAFTIGSNEIAETLATGVGRLIPALEWVADELPDIDLPGLELEAVLDVTLGNTYCELDAGINGSITFTGTLSHKTLPNMNLVTVVTTADGRLTPTTEPTVECNRSESEKHEITSATPAPLPPWHGHPDYPIPHGSEAPHGGTDDTPE